jgi:hypothetical protein
LTSLGRLKAVTHTTSVMTASAANTNAPGR